MDGQVKAVEAAIALTAESVLDILETAFHASKSEWVFLRELRVGTGRSAHSLQRLDAFALNCLAHLAMKRVCYEVKLSRADFFCEVKNPLKRRIGMRYSNEFFFVTPVGMLALDEIPTDCGLIEVSGWSCMVTVGAPWRDTPAPTWQFSAAMLRNQQRSMLEKNQPPPRQQKLDLR